MNKYSHIIWDWNGTLLDDVQHCMDVMNRMLEKRGMAIMPTVSDYHRAFVFPVVRYYENVGFDFEKESFESLAIEFIAGYHADKTGHSLLHRGAEQTLKALNEKGLTQIILSASKQENLLAQTKEFPIAHYFHDMLGLTDIYAKSKIEIGQDYMQRNSVKKALLIGDSVHDYEVATALGADCILVSNGHQSKQALQACSVPVVDDIAEILEFIS
ncbi:MAG: HAD hydrolase-like protein [Turicibacter sp.]|nr:HAD hydrolase-like protein [Turicibacter sp.]